MVRNPGYLGAAPLCGAELGDRRLKQRLRTMAQDFCARPRASLPQACQSRAKMKAAYRFFEHAETE